MFRKLSGAVYVRTHTDAWFSFRFERECANSKHAVSDEEIIFSIRYNLSPLNVAPPFRWTRFALAVRSISPASSPSSASLRSPLRRRRRHHESRSYFLLSISPLLQRCARDRSKFRSGTVNPLAHKQRHAIVHMCASPLSSSLETERNRAGSVAHGKCARTKFARSSRSIK